MSGHESQEFYAADGPGFLNRALGSKIANVSVGLGARFTVLFQWPRSLFGTKEQCNQQSAARWPITSNIRQFLPSLIFVRCLPTCIPMI
jgi:hypothetical protein